MNAVFEGYVGKPHAFEKNTHGFNRLICECGKHEAHSVHHAKRSMRRRMTLSPYEQRVIELIRAADGPHKVVVHHATTKSGGSI